MPADIPWEIRLTLRAGSVYYFQERGLTSAEPHYFIVVNSRPLAQQLVILAVITSNVERVKRLRSGLPGTVSENDAHLGSEGRTVALAELPREQLLVLQHGSPVAA